MRQPLVAILLSALVSSSAAAQDTPPPPAIPPTVEPAPPAPEAPPTPPAQVWDGEKPPAPRAPATPPPPPAPRRRPPTVVVEERDAGLGLELATNSFASGDLQGGFLIGVHLASGTLLGFRVDYGDTTTKVGSESNSRSALALGAAGRFVVAGGDTGFDLVLGADIAVVQADIDDASNMTTVEATGFSFGIGPQLRYWVHPKVAVGYLAQVSLTKTTAEAPGSSEKFERTVTGFGGTFTLTAGL